MFEWQDTYTVGVTVIDEQHRELFELMHAMQQGYGADAPVKRGRAVFVQLLTEVVTKAKAHFATEQALMRQWNYPHLAEHQQVHDSLAEHAEALLERVRSGNSIGPAEVLRFLGNWLAHHISAADQRLGEFLVERDVR
jgi:hemerythrin